MKTYFFPVSSGMTMPVLKCEVDTPLSLSDTPALTDFFKQILRKRTQLAHPSPLPPTSGATGSICPMLHREWCPKSVSLSLACLLCPTSVQAWFCPLHICILIGLLCHCLFNEDTIQSSNITIKPVSYKHLRANETRQDLLCRLLLEKK